MIITKYIIKKIKVPEITKENKWLYALVIAIGAEIIYAFSNHVQWVQASYLPLTVLDVSVPFREWTIWVYLSEYVMLPLGVALVADLKHLRRILITFALMQVFCVLIFMAYPTVYSREFFPLSGEAGSLTYQLFYFLRGIDSPFNCLPSLHVATCTLFSLMFLKEDKRKFYFFSFWTILISLSTLSTKQHYFIDVLAGVIVACIFYFQINKRLEEKNIL